MTTYSHSRLETYENCPFRYKLQYIDRVKRGSEGIEAFVGTCVHSVLERLYRDLRLCRTYTLPELLDLYRETWEKGFHEEITITRPGLTCDNYFDFGRKCLTNYFKRYQPFDQAVTLATELKVNFALDAEGRYRVTGFIDRLDQRADGAYEVHDYKTSASPPDEAKLRTSRQLGFYHLAVTEKFSDADRVELIWHYPAIDKEYRVILEEQQLEALKAQAIDLIDEIEAARKFEPHETALCGWCAYPDLCPAARHPHKVEQMPANEYLKEEGVALVNRYAELKDQEKELKAEMEKMKEALIAYAAREDVEVIRGNTRKARVKLSETVKYPGAGTEARTELEELLASAGRLAEVNMLDVRKLARAVEGDGWEEELVEKVKGFGEVEARGEVRLSRLRDEEVFEEDER